MDESKEGTDTKQVEPNPILDQQESKSSTVSTVNSQTYQLASHTANRLDQGLSPKQTLEKALIDRYGERKTLEVLGKISTNEEMHAGEQINPEAAPDAMKKSA